MAGEVCDVCEKEPTIGVACVPGVPMSVAYCPGCLQANAHPWWVLVANTAAMGGLDEAAGWWVDMVHDTCTHLGRTITEFEADVDEQIGAVDEQEARLEAELDELEKGDDW